MKYRDLPVGPVVKNPPCRAGDTGLIPGQGIKMPHTLEPGQGNKIPHTLGPGQGNKIPHTLGPGQGTKIQYTLGQLSPHAKLPQR